MKTSTFSAGLLLAATALLLPLSASAQTMFGYQVLVDADANAATGCSITPTGGATLAGFEHRLLIDVQVTSGSAEVSSLDRQDCSGGSFSAPVAVTSPASPPWPVGLDLGVGGADVVEAGVLRDVVGAALSAEIRLAFVADDGEGSDVLATTDGSASGDAILLGLPLDPVQIPLFSLWGIVLLLLAVVILGWLAQRKLGRIGAMSVVLLIAGLAWAMNFMLDGAVTDWTGVPPVGQDPTGDATDGSSGNELIAGFAAFENGALYFRIDVADVENQAPEAFDDALSVDEDDTLSEPAPGVLGNDLDADLDPLTATLTTGPNDAQAFTLNPDGSFDYTPNPDFNGTDTFTYIASDGQANSAAATVTITVNAINDPPVALDDNGATQEDQQVDVDVLANDSDVDGSLDPATVMVTSGPANGTTSVNPTNGVITYTKAADFNGADSFDYEVCDDGTPLPAECATATVSITIDPVNDPPTISAIADQTIDEDTSTGPLAFTIDDVDDAVASLMVMASSSNQALIPDANLTLAGTAPNLTVEATPTADQNGGPVTITLSVDDGTAPPVTTTFNVTVNPVNDPPVADAGSATTDEDTQVTIPLTGSDIDGDSLMFAIDTAPTNGSLGAINTLTATSAEVTYTPNPDFNGSDSFSFLVNDGTVDSAPAIVSITVDAVNDPPTITAIADQTIDEDTSTGPLAFTIDDVDDAVASLMVMASSSNQALIPDANLTLAGTAPNLTIETTPAADQNGGPVTITLSVDDGTAPPVTTSFDVTVNPVNDPPVADAGNATTDEDTPVTIPLTGSDIDGDSLMFAIDTAPTNGSLGAINTLAATSAEVTYTPNADFNGSDSFTFTVDDGTATSAATTVTITIDPVNDPPTISAIADQAIDEDSSTGPLAFTIDDVDDAVASLMVMASSSNQALIPDANLAIAGTAPNLTIEATPAADQNGGPVTITLSVDDGTAPPVTMSFDVTVNPVNDPPTAMADSYDTDEDTDLVIPAPGVLGNDSDVDTGDTLTAVLDTDVSDGTLTFNSDGSFTYDPDLNFNGADSFTYHANDGTTDSATVTVTITVTAVNDGPNAMDDMIPTDEDTFVDVLAPGVLFNDTDPEMDSLMVVSHDVMSAQGAAVMVNADGSFSYDPTGSTALQALAASDSLNDTFTYTIEDPSGINPDTATVTIAVTGVDDPPTAMDDTAMVTEDDPATTVDVQANDTDPDGGSNTISAVTQPTNGTVVITNAGADLTYEPNPNYCYDGMTTDDFTYTLSPGGDTATVAVTVSCVNDPPMADDEVVAAVCNIESVVETAPSQTADAAGEVFRSVADNVLLGDSDPVEGTAVSIVEAGGDTTEPFDITTNEGGSATLYADGSFVYTPEGGDRGVADSFTYTIEDADGGQDTATVTLNVGSTCIWFVDNSVSATDDVGTGTSSDPFTSLVDEIGPDALPDDAEDAALAGDVVYVFEGDSNSGDAYQGGFVAEPNQTILGEGVDLVVDLGGGPETLFDASADSTDNPPLVSSSTGETFSVVAVTGVEIAGFNVASSGDSGIGINAITGPVGAFVHDNAIASTASEAMFIGQTDAGTSTVTLIGNTFSSTVSDGLRVDVSAGTLELAVDNNTDVIGATHGFNIDGTGGTLFLTSFCGNAISGDTGGTGVLVASAIFDANPGDPDFFGDEVECPLGLTVGDPANRLDTGNGLVLTSVTGDLDLGPLNIWVGSAGGGDEVALRVTAADPFDAAAGNGFQLTTLAGTVDSSDGPALDIDPVDLENMVLTTVISQNSSTVGVGLTEVSGSFTTNGGNSNITGAAGNAFEIVDTPFGGLTVTYDGDITNTSAAALLVDGHPAGTVTFSGGTISDIGGTGLQFDDADGSYQITSAATLNGGDAGVDVFNGSSGAFNFTNTTITSPSGPGVRVADSGPSSVSFTGSGSLTYATAGQPAVELVNRSAGTFTFSRPITVTDGTGLQFNNDDGTTTTFNSSVTLNGGDAGIDIVNGSSGSYTFANTTITSPTGVAFNVDSSSGGITYSAGGVTQTNAAAAVRFNSHSSGIVTLNAPITGNTGVANAVELTGANGGVYNFRGGLDLDTTTGIAFNATGGGNGVNVCTDSLCSGAGSAVTNTVDVNGAAFAGINFVNTVIGGSGVTFNTVNVNGAADGINLVNTGSGDFAALGGTIQNVTARGVDVSGGSGDIRIDASIDTTTTGRSVEVTTHTGGTVDFNSFIDDDGIGIRLENNVGAILRFDGGMALDTGTDTAFRAVGGGTVNVTGTNDVGSNAAVTRRAVEIIDTTIGASGVTFRSVHVDGGGTSAVPGIHLDDTGAGDFTVAGGGASGSGGTMQNIMEDAVRLFNTDGAVSLSDMIIEDIGDMNVAAPGHHGIDGEQVDGGLSVDNVTIRQVSDSAIHGEAPGGGSTTWDGLSVTNSTLAFSNRFHIGGAGDGGATDEAMITIEGITGTVAINSNDFDHGPGFINLFTAASGSIDVTVQANTMDDGRKDLMGQPSVGSSGIRINHTGTIASAIRIGDPAEANPALGNVMVDTGSDAAIFISGFTAADNADVDLVISQNSITVNDHLSPPGLGPIFDFPNGGIGVESRGSGTFEAIISNNTLVEPQNSGGLSTGAIRVDVSGPDTEVIVRNNTVTRAWDSPLFVRADNLDGNGARGFLLFENNTYNDGPIGDTNAGDGITDDLEALGFGGSPSPFLPNRFQIRNGAVVDLTILDDDMVSHDTASNPGFDSIDIRINGDTVAAPGSTSILNVLIQNTEAPEDFLLRNDDDGIDASDSELNLARGLSADPAATDINDVAAESVLDDNGNTTGGGGPSANVPFNGVNIVTTTPTLPVVTPP